VTTFSGKKFDFMKAARFDRTVTDYAYRVLGVIVDHLNERSERCRLSDETIAWLSGGSRKKVLRARHNLKSRGWLRWMRTPSASIYSVNWGAAKPALAVIRAEQKARREKFNKTEEKRQVMSQDEDITPRMEGCPTGGTADVPPVGHKHLKRTPSKEGLHEGRGRLREEVSSLANGGRVETAADEPGDEAAGVPALLAAEICGDAAVLELAAHIRTTGAAGASLDVWRRIVSSHPRDVLDTAVAYQGGVQHRPEMAGLLHAMLEADTPMSGAEIAATVKQVCRPARKSNVAESGTQ
jgi:hypothetical protein